MGFAGTHPVLIIPTFTNPDFSKSVTLKARAQRASKGDGPGWAVHPSRLAQVRSHLRMTDLMPDGSIVPKVGITLFRDLPSNLDTEADLGQALVGNPEKVGSAARDPGQEGEDCE